MTKIATGAAGAQQIYDMKSLHIRVAIACELAWQCSMVCAVQCEFTMFEISRFKQPSGQYPNMKNK